MDLINGFDRAYVYGPTELKSLPHIFESVYTKWNVGLNGYFVFVYVLVNELG